jgi:hypothetical protein
VTVDPTEIPDGTAPDPFWSVDMTVAVKVPMIVALLVVLVSASIKKTGMSANGFILFLANSIYS